MGLVNAKIQLRNPRLPELEPVEIDALADTGAVHMCIPSHIQIQLKLEEIGLLLFKGEEINLQQGLQEQIVMTFPLQPLCAQDCKGLCPQCGSDLNLKACGCEHTASSNKFAALKNLKLDKP